MLLAHVQQLESSFLSFCFLHEALSRILGPALGSDTGLNWGMGHWGHIVLKTKLEFFVPGYSEWFWGTRRDEDFLRTTDQVNHHKSCQIRAFEIYKIFLPKSAFWGFGLGFLERNYLSPLEWNLCASSWSQIWLEPFWQAIWVLKDRKRFKNLKSVLFYKGYVVGGFNVLGT